MEQLFKKKFLPHVRSLKLRLRNLQMYAAPMLWFGLLLYSNSNIKQVGASSNRHAHGVLLQSASTASACAAFGFDEQVFCLACALSDLDVNASATKVGGRVNGAIWR